MTKPEWALSFLRDFCFIFADTEAKYEAEAQLLETIHSQIATNIVKILTISDIFKIFFSFIIIFFIVSKWQGL